MKLYYSGCTYFAGKASRHDRSAVMRERREKLWRISPKSKIGGGTFRGDGAPLTDDSLHWPSERGCAKRTSSQVRVRGRVFPAIGLGTYGNAALTLTFPN